MDVWDYFGRRKGEIDEMSLSESDVQFYEEAGSDGMRGRILGSLFFTEDAYLAVQERVEIIDGVPHRTDYAYFFIVGGVEYWGFERDPSHDPAVHRHVLGHKRAEADAVGFKHVCGLAWREVSVLSSQSTDHGDEP